ncbi:MAG: exodeoxyribonuclease V subunit alpha [Xanthomonadaceae bacterium]|nr:exodeoxyribonuclease V subunit alpha [Xanthomonadaceae bacterium]
MSGFDFAPRALPPSLGALRPFDRTLARWVLANGGSNALAEIAALAAFAEAQGHACLVPGLPGVPAFDPSLLDAAAGDPMLGDGGTPTPFVRDADDRIYLWRNFRHEQVAAAHLARRRAAAAPPSPEALAPDLAVLFGGAAQQADPLQRAAVAAVAGRRFVLLTGGPGTGKTTTVLRMLLLLARRTPGVPPRIALAAPTGKAAQRLAESLREGKARLAADLPADWQALLPGVNEGEATTVHRLLGWHPALDRWRHGPGDPLPHDVVVVDEASMLDLAMLRALLDALRPEATVVLVGDAEQLGSVGAGSVLADLVAALAHDDRGDLVRLSRVFRASAPLAGISAAVGAGDTTALRAALDAAGPAASIEAIGTAAAQRHALHGWADAIAAGWPRVGPDPRDPDAPAQAAAALAALRRMQLLCALREGPFGADAANALLVERLRDRFGVAGRGTSFGGRALLVTHNDHARRLYNGDVGLELEAPDGRVWAWFPARAGDGGAGARAIAPAALPPHAAAFALTVHKSQGSEYDAVAVLLPPDAAHPILGRELLYTAVSRARERLCLWATPAALDACLARAPRRGGGLRERLAQASAALD